MGNLCATSSSGYTPEVRGGKAERLLNKLCETFKEITTQSSDNSDRQVVSLKLVKRSVSLVNESDRQSVKLLRRLGDDQSSSMLVKRIHDLRSGADEFLKGLLDHLRKLEKEPRELLDALKRWTAPPDRKEKKEEPRSWWNFFKWWKRRGTKVEDEVLEKLDKFNSGKKFCKDFQKSLNRLVVQQNRILEEFQRQEISKSIRPQRLKRAISIILLGFLLAFLIASIVAAVALPVNLPGVDRATSNVAKTMMELVNSERLASWIDGLWKTKLNELQLHEVLRTRERRSGVDKEAMLCDLLPVSSSVDELKKGLESQRSVKELHPMKKKLQKKLSKAIDRIHDSIEVVQSCKNNIVRRGQGSSNTNNA